MSALQSWMAEVQQRYSADETAQLEALSDRLLTSFKEATFDLGKLIATKGLDVVRGCGVCVWVCVGGLLWGCVGWCCWGGCRRGRGRYHSLDKGGWGHVCLLMCAQHRASHRYRPESARSSPDMPHPQQARVLKL